MDSGKEQFCLWDFLGGMCEFDLTIATRKR